MLVQPDFFFIFFHCFCVAWQNVETLQTEIILLYVVFYLDVYLIQIYWINVNINYSTNRGIDGLCKRITTNIIGNNNILSKHALLKNSTLFEYHQNQSVRTTIEDSKESKQVCIFGYKLTWTFWKFLFLC